MGLAELVKAIIDQHPGIGVTLTLILVLVTWYVAISYNNFSWMRRTMVTKDDLTIAIAAFREEMHKELQENYVNRREFNGVEKRRGHHV